LDLPEKLEPVIILCENKEKQLYKTAEKSYIEELQMNFANPLVKVSKLRQIASGFIIDDNGKYHELASEKISMLEDLLNDILPNKIVIFAHYTHSIDAIYKLCKKLKVKATILNGKTKDKNVWKDFQEDDSIKVFIGQYQSAREGIDLFASSHVVFYEPCLDTRTLYQASDRCHRIGQHNPVSYYHLITKGTIEEVIYKRLSLGENLNANYLKEIVEKGEFRNEDYI
jgi:SNF2 family DNA or RNA helicase